MSIVGIIAVVIILVVVVSIFGTQLESFYNDVTNDANKQARDDASSTPDAIKGDNVCDLLITVQLRSTSAVSSNLVGTERILYTDGHAQATERQISWNWDNCRVFNGNTLQLTSLIQYLKATSMPSLEFFVPSADTDDQKVILSFNLVDSKSLDNKPTIYQEVNYIHPQYQTIYDFEQKLVFNAIEPDTFNLEITPTEAHFDNFKVGEPYRKVISPPS